MLSAVERLLGADPNESGPLCLWLKKSICWVRVSTTSPPKETQSGGDVLLCVSQGPENA